MIKDSLSVEIIAHYSDNNYVIDKYYTKMYVVPVVNNLIRLPNGYNAIIKQVMYLLESNDDLRITVEYIS